jgi:hypothetical protein
MPRAIVSWGTLALSRMALTNTARNVSRRRDQVQRREES